MRQPEEIPEELAALTAGDEAAAGRLMDVVYEELRALAGNYFRSEPEGHTLQPTALVNEAFIRVANRTGHAIEDRAHFLAVCALAMRAILTDHARRRRRIKRGGGRKRVDLTGIDASHDDPGLDALALDEALTALAENNERQARIVEYRFFSGMTIEEIRTVLGVSRSTVEDDWRMARAWLKVRLGAGPAT